MSSYKVTKFSAANIAGDCKLVDNKLKSSGGSDITFPSSGGTLATLADSVSKVLNFTVNLGGSAGTLYLKYIEIGAGDNKIQMMNARVELAGPWGVAGVRTATNSKLAGLGEWGLYFPTTVPLNFTGRFAVEVKNDGTIRVASPLDNTVDASGATGYCTYIKTTNDDNVSITVA